MKSVSILTLLVCYLIAAVVAAPVVTEEEADFVEVFDLDQDIEPAASEATQLFKRVIDGSIPRFMFPFIAVINVDLPQSNAESLFTTTYPSITAFTLNNLFNTYADYSHPYCSGAVIDEHWILTAARCINDIQRNGWLSSMKIYSNRKQLRPTVLEAWVQFKLINGTESIFYNKLYTNTTDDNDLVLLNVQAYDRRDRFIKKLHSARYQFPRIANQADADEYLNTSLTTGGWGLTDTEISQGNGYQNYSDYFFLVRYAPVFRAISTVAINQTVCAQRTGLTASTNVICTVPEANTDGTLCSWDSGAPLFVAGSWIPNRASYNSKLVALFSRYYLGASESVCGENTTSVHTYLPAYCQWIGEVTNNKVNCYTEVEM